MSRRIGKEKAVKNILDQVGRLSRKEKLELLEAVGAALAEELASRGRGRPAACPHCGCGSFVKRGRDADGSQRWLCRGCARTFSAKTMGLLASSKLDAATWMGFAECLVDALPLRECARRCGTSPCTAWFMRMRACEVMGRRLAPCRAGTFHVDDTHLVESLSGNHARPARFDMPRRPHRNGRDGRRAAPSARSKGRVAITCGVNEYGDCFCELAAEGAPSAADGMFILGDRVPEGSRVVTDGDLACAAAMGSGSLEGRAHEAAGCREINMANALHSRLKGFPAPFHGVAARRLQRYLDWFRYREQFKNGDADKRELLFAHETEGRYMWTRALTHLEWRPFVGYYDRRRYAEMTGHISTVV